MASTPKRGESTTAGSAAAKSAAKRGSLWSATAAATSILISVIALIIAVLSYLDQHNADIAAANASEEADANLVSFWAPNSNEVVIQNLGQTPVFNITLTFGDFVTGPGQASVKNRNMRYPASVGTLPPCSVATIDTENLLQSSSQGLRNRTARLVFREPVSGTVKSRLITSLEGTAIALQALAAETPASGLVIQISFTDPNGHDWSRSITGTLTKTTPPFVVEGRYESLQTQPAVGCS